MNWSVDKHRIMSAGTQALLREALRLPVPERAKFASELLDSLEGVAENPEEARILWLVEINRCAESVDDGTAEFESWDRVRERMSRRFGGWPSARILDGTVNELRAPSIATSGASSSCAVLRPSRPGADTETRRSAIHWATSAGSNRTCLPTL